MTLWMLLMVFNVMMPVVGACVAATRAGGGSNYAIAIVTGVVLSAVYGWLIHRAGRVADARYNGKSQALFRLLYIGAIVWIFVGLLTGLFLTKRLLLYV